MAYIYMHKDSNEGVVKLMKDDAELAANPNHNNSYKQFTITTEQYDDLRLGRKVVSKDALDNLTFTDEAPYTYNTLEELNTHIQGSYPDEGSDKRKTFNAQVRALDFSDLTFPITNKNVLELIEDKGVIVPTNL